MSNETLTGFARKPDFEAQSQNDSVRFSLDCPCCSYSTSRDNYPHAVRVQRLDPCPDCNVMLAVNEVDVR